MSWWEALIVAALLIGSLTLLFIATQVNRSEFERQRDELRDATHELQKAVWKELEPRPPEDSRTSEPVEAVSLHSLPPDVRTRALEVLTPKQQEAFDMELAGWGLGRIAMTLRTTRGAARDRLHNAHKNLLNAGVRQDEQGRWTVETKEAA